MPAENLHGFCFSSSFFVVVAFSSTWLRNAHREYLVLLLTMCANAQQTFLSTCFIRLLKIAMEKSKSRHRNLTQINGSLAHIHGTAQHSAAQHTYAMCMKMSTEVRNKRRKLCTDPYPNECQQHFGQVQKDARFSFSFSDLYNEFRRITCSPRSTAAPAVSVHAKPHN